ncbi:MAG: TIGR03086 family protein [Ilumatobacter sp.]|nr:TIGR03086 family protein [Ilumatobacter sp.]
MSATPEQQIAMLQGIYDHTGSVISAVGPDDLGKPTPCTEWDVRALLDHMIGAVNGIAAAVQGSAPEGEPTEITSGDDAHEAFTSAAQASIAAWSADGVFDGPVNLGAAMPAEAAMGVNMLDTLTHSWDLAEAIGHDRSMDPALAEAALGASRMIISDDFRPGRFGPEVEIAAAAPAHDRLAAFLGRHPS